MSSTSSNYVDVWEKLNDDSCFDTNWMVVQFNDKNEITLSGSGSGGYSEGCKMLKDEVMFLVVRGCHFQGKMVEKIILVLLFIPENVTGFERSKAAYQVDVLSKSLKIEHFCLIDTRKNPNVEIESVVEQAKSIIGGGKFVINESSNTILENNLLEQAEKIERRQSKMVQQTKKNVVKEILETEEQYVRSLNLFLKEYVTPLKEMVPEYHRSLQSLVSVIININEQFLKKLKEIQLPEKYKKRRKSRAPAPPPRQKGPPKKPRRPPKLGRKPGSTSKAKKEQAQEEEEEGEDQEDEETKRKKNIAQMVSIIISHCPVFKLYLPYVNEYTKLVEKTGQLMEKNAEFREFCSSKNTELTSQKERCTDIYGFLIMPVQRIPRYQLLMRDLLKHTHPSDPNFGNIKEGCLKTVELAEYVNEKKAEADMSLRRINLAQMLQMNDLMDRNRKLLNFNSNCMIKKEESMICVFTDLLLLIRGGNFKTKKKIKKSKVDRISLCDPIVRVFVENEELSLETERKKHVVGFKNKPLAESFSNLILSRLSFNLGRVSMSQRLVSHIIFQSMLLKLGGKNRTRRKKRRWHELTADLTIKYFDKPNGKMKGSYSIQGGTFGKGSFDGKGNVEGPVGMGSTPPPSLNRSSGESSSSSTTSSSTSRVKVYDFYVTSTTTKRTYQLYAGNVEILDIWVKVLELVGLKREDLIDKETENLHQSEIQRLHEERDERAEMAEEDDRKQGYTSHTGKGEFFEELMKEYEESQSERLKKLNNMMKKTVIIDEEEGELEEEVLEEEEIELEEEILEEEELSEEEFVDDGDDEDDEKVEEIPLVEEEEIMEEEEPPTPTRPTKRRTTPSSPSRPPKRKTTKSQPTKPSPSSSASTMAKRRIESAPKRPQKRGGVKKGQTQPVSMSLRVKPSPPVVPTRRKRRKSVGAKKKKDKKTRPTPKRPTTRKNDENAKIKKMRRRTMVRKYTISKKKGMLIRKREKVAEIKNIMHKELMTNHQNQVTRIDAKEVYKKLKIAKERRRKELEKKMKEEEKDDDKKNKNKKENVVSSKTKKPPPRLPSRARTVSKPLKNVNKKKTPTTTTPLPKRVPRASSKANLKNVGKKQPPPPSRQQQQKKFFEKKKKKKVTVMTKKKKKELMLKKKSYSDVEVREIVRKERMEWEEEMKKKMEEEKVKWMETEWKTILEKKKKQWTEKIKSELKKQ